MSEEVKNRIQRNKRLIFDAEAYVQFNTAQVQSTRSRVEENVTDAMQAYTITASGNRELVMRTLDDVYRNRLAMLETLKPASDAEELFQRTMTNRVRLEYLENRSRMNREMLKASESMIEAIKQLQAVAANYHSICERMQEHADEMADKNAQWFDGELLQLMHAATTTNNDARAMENYDLVTGLRTNSLENRKTIQQVAAHSADLAESLGELQDNANEQRDELVKLREKIDANQNRVADSMFAM
ncbi:hypothetical protein MCEMIEM12_01236 [Burkholderiaceae bacterium]